MEATGHYWLALYAALTARYATVQVIHPIQSDSLRNLYIRVTKTDTKDSVLIADLVRIGRYTKTVVPEETALALRDLSRLRVEFSVSLGSLKRKPMRLWLGFFPNGTDCGATRGVRRPARCWQPIRLQPRSRPPIRRS